jgi:hypothetical protein
MTQKMILKTKETMKKKHLMKYLDFDWTKEKERGNSMDYLMAIERYSEITTQKKMRSVIDSTMVKPRQKKSSKY